MRKLALVLGFIAMIAIQWLLPGKMISDQALLRSQGTEFNFHSELLDPNDPFRGKYVTLRYAPDTLYLDQFSDSLLRQHTEGRGKLECYVVFGNDERGFAEPIDAFMEPPGHTSDYLKMEVRVPFWHPDSNEDERPNYVMMSYPFKRLYMEESKAPAAERVYWKSMRNDSIDTYSVVSIKDGAWSLVDVRINGRSLKEVTEDAMEAEALDLEAKERERGQ